MATDSRARRRRRPPRIVRGLLHPACGPLVRVSVGGAGSALQHGLAVLDTGATMSAVDREIARLLRLSSPGAASWRAVHASDHERPLSPLRTARIRLAELPRWWELDLIEVAGLRDTVAGYRVVALIGWDLLRDCRMTCDGPAGTFELEVPRR